MKLLTIKQRQWLSIGRQHKEPFTAFNKKRLPNNMNFSRHCWQGWCLSVAPQYDDYYYATLQLLLSLVWYACPKPSNRTEWTLLETKEKLFSSFNDDDDGGFLCRCDEGKVFHFFCYIRCGVMLAINMTQCTINICLFISNFLTPPADFLPL